MAKTILKEKTIVERFSLLVFKAYYKTIVINTCGVSGRIDM